MGLKNCQPAIWIRRRKCKSSFSRNRWYRLLFKFRAFHF